MTKITIERFPNLARREQDHEAEAPRITEIVKEELRQAGLHCFDIPVRPRREVPTGALGYLEGTGWTFERAWRYWIAEGPGLPLEVAERLYQDLGSEVRVGGDCTGPSPRSTYHGFGVPLYHIDTPRGLKALADALKSVLEANQG